jgi:ribosomal protein S18 acetylase RimI-like enzyme
VVDFDVRLASAADLDALVALNAHVHALHVAERPDFFKLTEPVAMRAWFAEQLAKPNARIWLAEQDGVALGYLFALLRDNPETVFCFARRWFELDQIAVAPQHRHRNVARQLVEAALAAARGDGVTHVELASWCFNQVAHAAFRRLGFTPKVTRFERTA